jgi:hypothetical protein
VGDGSYYGGTCFSMTQAAGEDWQWQYGYLHDIRGLMWQLNYKCDGFTIEYCYAARNIAYDYQPGKNAHIEAYKGNASLNGIFRYSIFEDIRGTGFLVIFNNNYQIHGNVFRWTAGFDGSVGNGVITSLSAASATNVKVYNNTFININRNLVGVNVSSDNQNNLTFQCIKIFTGSTNTALPGMPEPFVSQADLDFHLKSPTAAGKALPAPFNKDPFGVTYGADGNWDRGAYEYSTTNIECRTLNAERRMPFIPTLINDGLFYNIMGKSVQPDVSGIYLGPISGQLRTVTRVK